MKEHEEGHKVSETVNLVLKSVALAMGVAVVVLSLLKAIETVEALSMLGAGLACLAVSQFPSKE